MFGYITPAFEVLSEEDKLLFRSFYCSLCREIGKSSQAARLALSYDMTFLAILLSALAEDVTESAGKQKCLLHPIKAATERFENDPIKYAADLSIILTKAKFDDDINDDRSLKARIGNILLSDNIEGREKERTAISTALKALYDIEYLEIHSPDQAADSFAKLCADIFSLPSEKDTEREALYWLGYNLGRWIYLTDAINDLEKDIKKGSYNPYADGRSYSEILKDRKSDIEESLCFTLSQAAAAFDLLDIKRYRSLLENIIYTGLPARLKAVLYGKSEEQNESI